MIIEALILGAAYFCFVFFKAFQQRNVAHLHYYWIMPVSFALSFTDVMVMALVAHKTVTSGLSMELVWIGIAIATGGGLGAMTSMKLHERFLTK